eukprot:3521-Heterococcus_DN1.PRE.1
MCAACYQIGMLAGDEAVAGARLELVYVRASVCHGIQPSLPAQLPVVVSTLIVRIGVLLAIQAIGAMCCVSVLLLVAGAHARHPTQRMLCLIRKEMEHDWQLAAAAEAAKQKHRAAQILQQHQRRLLQQEQQQQQQQQQQQTASDH